MKKILMQTTFAICAVFTVMMMLYLIAGLVLTGPQPGIVLGLSVFAGACTCGVLQAFWFTPLVFKGMRYAARLAGFALTLAPALYVCGWFGGWFPQAIEPAILFFAIFLVLFALIAAGYAIYFRKTAGSYQEALEAYRTKQGQK